MDPARELDPEFLTPKYSFEPRQPRAIPLRVLHKGSSQLQWQIERQRQLARSTGRHTSKSKPRHKDALPAEQTPLVPHGNDGEDSGYMAAHLDIEKQLREDGYKLDEVPDDEELDLIMMPHDVPRPLHQRCACGSCCACACTIL